MLMVEEEKKRKAPEWIPDWTNKSAYFSSTEDTKEARAQWAWEFIRRNPEYQKFYLRARRYPADWYKKNPDDQGFYKYFFCTPKANKMESYNQYLQRCELEGNKPTIKEKREIIAKFPVKQLSLKLNPKCNIPPEFTIDYTYPHLYSFDRKEVFKCKISDTDEVVVVFSIKLSLDEQLKKTKIYLKEMQDSLQSKEIVHVKSRYRPENYQNYLRMLDAELKGIKQTEMAKTIYGTQEKSVDRVNKGLKEARYLRDIGHLGILKTAMLY